MKKRTQKIQSKINLIAMYKMHPANLMSDDAKQMLVKINDEDLNDVVKNFLQAKQELESYLDKMKQDLTPYLPDDSDF